MRFFTYFMELDTGIKHCLKNFVYKVIQPGDTKWIGETGGNEVFYKYYTPWFEDIYTCNGEVFHDFCREKMEQDDSDTEVTYWIKN